MVQEIDLVGIIGVVLDGLGSERHAEVLRRRLGTESAPPMTLEQVGAELGVTRERARQLEEKALDRLTASIRRGHSGLRGAVIDALRPKEQGYDDRVAAATALVAPDWPARVARKLMMRLAGGKVPQALADQRSMRLVYAQGEAATQPVTPASQNDDAGDFAMDVYEAVAAHYQVEVDGRWKRFSSKGWFYVGQSVAGCPGCRLVLEAFRHPYVTSAGVQYHYWALVCLKCRAAWPPSDLDGDGRKELYKCSEHRPDAITT